MDNREVDRLNSTLYSFRNQKGDWPTVENWDSLKFTDRKLNHITKIDFKTQGDTLITQFRVEYDKYENQIKAINASQLFLIYDSSYYFVQPRKVEFELQGGILLGTRTTLTQSEKLRLRTWLKELKEYNYSKQVIIQDLQTKKIRKVHLNEELSVITKTDTLYPVKVKWDSVNKKYNIEDLGEWYLTKVNSQTDSITLTNYKTEESRTIYLNEIDHLIYINNRQFRYNQIAGVTFLGSLAWTAIGIKADQDERLNIAAITLSAASLVYLITALKKTGERKYKFIKIVE